MNKRLVHYDEIEGIAWTHTPQGDKVIVSWADRHWIEDYSVWRYGRKRYPYAGIQYQYKPQFLHSMVMQSQGYQGIVDHINRNTFDNRRENLRPATQSENQHNYPKQANTSSRFLGVSWHKQHNKWQARIEFKVDGKSKQKHLGYFSSEIEAALIYDLAAPIVHGSHSTTNASLGLLDDIPLATLTQSMCELMDNPSFMSKLAALHSESLQA